MFTDAQGRQSAVLVRVLNLRFSFDLYQTL
jgi:hypothetical protein